MVQLVYLILCMFFKVLPLLIFASAFSKPAIITKIIDGDTIHAKQDGKLIKVRLHCIDTPESKMVGKQKAQIVGGVNYGDLATQHLKEMLSTGETVDLKCFESDRYERSVCVAWKEGLNINYLMLADGYAWLPKKYCKDINYEYAFESAKNSKLGLHSYDGFGDPQIFRNCARNNLKADCNN